MTSIKDFVDEHDLDATDIIDALDIDASDIAGVPEEPTAFYDGEPTVDELADDFDAVDLLVDEKDELAEKLADAREDLREARRPVFADKAEELASMTTKWGDKDTLMEKFDADADDERWTMDDIEDKLEIVRDIRSDGVTTPGGSDNGEDRYTADGARNSTDTEFDRTPDGKLDLSARR